MWTVACINSIAVLLAYLARYKNIKYGNYFYILPSYSTGQYGVTAKENLHEWEKLRDEIDPDIVIIWSSESRFAYTAMKAMKGIPMAIYIQGVIGSIYEHFYEGFL